MPLSCDADQKTGYRHNGSWGREYQKFMASPQWAVLRYRALRRDGYKCQCCGGKAVQVVGTCKMSRSMSEYSPASAAAIENAEM